MNRVASVAAAALLASAVNMADASALLAASFADSTGGSSQIRGELVTNSATSASRVPAIGDRRADTATAHAGSTGESSAARAEYLLDHAQSSELPGVATASRDRYQPFLDSTGGNSSASSERALEAEDAAAARRTAVATAPALRANR